MQRRIANMNKQLSYANENILLIVFISSNDQKILSVLAPHKLVEVESSDLLQTNHAIPALFLWRLH